jgi:hypothetical protein
MPPRVLKTVAGSIGGVDLQRKEMIKGKDLKILLFFVESEDSGRSNAVSKASVSLKKAIND